VYFHCNSVFQQTFAQRLSEFASSTAGIFLILLVPAVALTAFVVHRATRNQSILPSYAEANAESRVLRVPTTEEDGQRQDEAQEVMLSGGKTLPTDPSQTNPVSGQRKWLKSVDFLFPSISTTKKATHLPAVTSTATASNSRGGDFSGELEDSHHGGDAGNNIPPLSMPDEDYDEDGVALSAVGRQPLAMYDESHVAEHRRMASSNSVSTASSIPTLGSEEVPTGRVILQV
jgi:hypothetical protein